MYFSKYYSFLLSIIFSLFPILAFASGDTMIADTATTQSTQLNLTGTGYAITALILFIFAYMLVIGEEIIHLRKSKPVMLVAGIIWVLVALAYAAIGKIDQVEHYLDHNLLEYVQLLLFLLAAMTYINTMEERNVFSALRGFLVSRGYSLKKIFWITGLLSFFISPVADNLTTALLMSAVVISVAGGKSSISEDEHKKNFVVVSLINIVVAANAGGAFSPFGDITTLMVWQKEMVQFNEFFALFLPSIVNWLVPALIMSFVVSSDRPESLTAEVKIKRGGILVILLFIITIITAIIFHNYLHLPPMLGMMTGLGALKLLGYYLKMSGETHNVVSDNHSVGRWDIFTQLQRAEWDTLMFFYGVILCVGGLGAFGYLAVISDLMYSGLGATWANISVGFASAIVDNIPVMFAVLSMMPDMSHEQWLLVTLTAGVGGSLLSVGSAAGVALMGQARGIYTFFAHLKWTWAIALGYAASIYLHYIMHIVK